MLSALTLGLVLALAQHFTYVSLDGKPVASISVSQAWVSRISTGLAFAVKVAFTICVGAAFIQHQWMRLRESPFKVVDVDTITSALGNLFCLFESTVWLRYPVLTLMAVVSWILPLSAVVTPGALSVEGVQNVTTTPMQVAQPVYNFTNYGMRASGGGTYEISEDARLTRLLTNTASAQTPVQLASSFQNQTYGIHFDGPALRCSSANDSVIRNLTGRYGFTSGPGDFMNFAAWVPGGDPSDYAQSSSTSSVSARTVDVASPDAARIFVMTNIGGWNNTLNFSTSYNTTRSATVVNVTECLLYNATYEVEFSFRYPNQTRNVEITKWINPVSSGVFGPGGEGAPFSQKDPEELSYLAMMSALGRLLLGQSTRSHYGYIIRTRTNWDMLSIDWASGQAVEVGLEQLFQNFTLSLLSDSGLIKNSTTADQVPVQIETWPITYVYRRADLFIPYGLSLLAALLCSALGMRAFLVNDASYSNIYSTYLRATNNARIDRYIDDSDTGHDPLPKSFGAVTINLTEHKVDYDQLDTMGIGDNRSQNS